MRVTAKEKHITYITFFLLSIAASAAVAYIPRDAGLASIKNFCSDNSDTCDDIDTLLLDNRTTTQWYKLTLNGLAVIEFVATILISNAAYLSTLCCTGSRQNPIYNIGIKSLGGAYFLIAAAFSTILSVLNLTNQCSTKPSSFRLCNNDFPNATQQKVEETDQLLKTIRHAYFTAKVITSVFSSLALSVLVPAAYAAQSKLIRRCWDDRRRAALLSASGPDGPHEPGSAAHGYGTL